MPERAALITLLIVERPLCLLCIAARVNLPSGDVYEYLGVIRDHLTVFHEDSDRCRACGDVTKVYALKRLPL